MNWKNWPYWIKGGLTGLLIGILYFLIGLASPSLGETLTNILAIILKPSLYFLSLVGFQQKLELWNIILSLGFALFIYGSILGWLYGKIKNRNSVPPPSSTL